MENQRFTHQFTLIFRKVVYQKQLNAIRIKKKTQIDRCGYWNGNLNHRDV